MNTLDSQVLTDSEQYKKIGSKVDILDSMVPCKKKGSKIKIVSYEDQMIQSSFFSKKNLEEPSLDFFSGEVTPTSRMFES